MLNDSRVIPARFGLIKASGGLVEGLFLQEIQPGRWEVMLKNLGRPRAGLKLGIVGDEKLCVAVIGQQEGGAYTIQLNPPEPASVILDRVGRMPLPPYIKRRRQHDPRDAADRERYQTVYARTAGSVAAPTAGLHFTERVFQELEARGVRRCFVTLHVGLGTFKPITSGTLGEHVMHAESYTVGPESAAALNRAKEENRRIIAVGTTAARVLESQPADRAFASRSDRTQIFIYPPYRWKHVDALITNFHLPRSTLIALVAAMTGLQEQRRLYRLAIEGRYRFFSYGDAMLIE